MASATAQERARQCGSFSRLSLDNKKSLVAAYQTSDVVDAKMKASSKSPTFRFVFDGANFGTKLHPKAELAARQSGRSAAQVSSEVAEQVSAYQGYLLAWLADIDHQQVLQPLLTAFEAFCLDEMNTEALLGVISGIGFAHAAQDDDTESHWKLEDGILWWVANTHCTAFITGHNVFPSPQVRGYYFEVFKAVCDLCAPPAAPVHWNARLSVIPIAQPSPSASDAGPSNASSTATGGAVGTAASPQAKAKSAASFAKLTLDQKKLLVACYETAETVQGKLREITKQPGFQFVINADHFGAKAHANVKKALTDRGYAPAYFQGDYAQQVVEWQTWLLGWLSSIEHEQLLPPMLRGFEQFCLDDMNRECLLEVISGVGFMHGPESDDAPSHFRLEAGIFYWVANSHSTASCDGLSIYPSGSWTESLKSVADLGAPQTELIKWDHWMNRIE